MARMLLVLVLIGAVAGQASGQAALPPFDATRFYDQARFDAAIVPYTQAIARNANDARAHYWLGVAYLYGARLYRFGLAPFAAGHAARAVAALERAVQLQAVPEVMLALADAYALVGAKDKHDALLARIAQLARPQPPR